MEETFYLVNGYKTTSYEKAMAYGSSVGNVTVATTTRSKSLEQGTDLNDVPDLPELRQ